MQVRLRSSVFRSTTRFFRASIAKLLRPTVRVCALTACLSPVGAAPAANPQPPFERTLRAYFVGNSLTMSTTLDRVHALTALRGIDLQFGSQLSGGKTLIRHLRYMQEPDQTWSSWETNVPAGSTFTPDPNHWQPQPLRFGRYDKALVDHKWDALVLQLHGPNLHDELLAVSGFIDLAQKHDSAKFFYLYSTWPFRPRPGRGAPPTNIDYASLWQAEYTAGPDDTSRAAATNVPSRSYTDHVLRHLRTRYPALADRIRLIPVGEVLFDIDRRLKSGELAGVANLARRTPALVPGFGDRTALTEGVNVLYADHIHFNPVPHKTPSLGIMISGMTVHTVLTGRNPIGLSAVAYALDDPRDSALVEQIQRIIWSIVTADRRTGVSP